MATKTTPKRMNRPFTDTVPDWPTAVKQVYNSGLVISIDNDVWLYRRCPMGPVTSAITEDDALRVGQPIFDSLVEIEGLTRTAVKSRRFSKNNYREFHMLLVNVPQRYVPDDDQPLKGFLSRQFSDAITYRRELLVGVKLRNSAFRSGWRQSVDVFYEALTLQNVGVQLPEYAADYRRVDAALTRAGLMVATRAEMHLADSWWNLGANPDVPYLVHSDHLHMFTSTTSMTEAARLEKADVDCREPEWSDLHNHHSLGFVGFDTFNYNWRDVKSLETNFVVELVRQGAMAVSFRGKVEPTAITRNELRTGRRRIRADITEAQAQGAMDRQEQEDKQAAIEQMESLYSSATLHLPTVIDASIVAALNGSLDGSYDVAGLTRTVKLSNLVERQEKALAEMMMGSQVRCNPLLRDLPATAMAFTGAPDLAVCGDTTGALLGFTEHDKQPVYISNDAASVGDALPLAICVGSTGSGKTQTLLNMAYQWAQAGIPQVVVDPKLLRLETRIPTPSGWTTMRDVQVGDRVIGRDGQPCNVVHKSKVFQPDEVTMFRFEFDDGQVLFADLQHEWVVATPKGRSAIANGRGMSVDELREASRKLTAAVSDLDGAAAHTTTDLLRRAQSLGVHRWMAAHQLSADLERAGVSFRSDPGRRRKTRWWEPSVAFKAMAAQVFNEAEMGSQHWQVATTEDLLRRLENQGNGRRQTYFATPVAAAIEGQHANLPVDPYLLGAWLGDGYRKAGSICAGASDAAEMHKLLQECWPRPITETVEQEGRVSLFGFPRAEDRCNYGHFNSWVPTVKDSKRCYACGTSKKDLTTATNLTLGHQLGRAGLIGNKRIPMEYLRASANQRLALLQGLMDTDGTVKRKRGECKITLSRKVLAEDVLTLIRSLGFKAHWHVERAVAVSRDLGGNAVRKVYGETYSITFQPHRPVFRLPRKLEVQPKPGFRAQFAYIKSITPVESEKGQCIRVDSPDHTYLVEDFLVTHNTGSDHSPTVLAAGGQVATFDDLKKSDGILDPLRFTQNVQAGLEFASSMLLQVEPWDKPAKQFETELMVALDYGVKEGATCIGQALKLAQDAGKASEELVKPVLDLANVSALFSAIVGRDPQTKGLAVADGITLIMVGDTNLELPPMGQPPSTLQQRIAVGLVRMMVFGSAMALTGRRGVLHFDEAWIATLAGPDELERLGRLARSQQVLPVLYTQRVTDVVKIGLSGYISRGIIMHLKDESEARAACELFKLEPTPERINRITASERSGGGSSESKEGALNWNSFKALFKPDPRDPSKRINVRGSVGIHVDLHGRAVPVVQDLPPEFLEMTSTNPEDIRRRTERMAALEASRQAALERHDLPGSDSEADADGLAIDDVFNLS